MVSLTKISGVFNLYCLSHKINKILKYEIKYAFLSKLAEHVLGGYFWLTCSEVYHSCGKSILIKTASLVQSVIIY